jgi:putative ABC transport system ATP-binding protein
MITCSSLSKKYNSKYNGLIDFTYTFKDFGFYGVFGHSGSGKSTLLNLLSLVDLPTTGTIKFDDIDVTLLSNKNRTLFRKDNISLFSQDYNLILDYTVFENILVKANLSNIEDKLNTINSIATTYGIESLLDKHINQLSGGEQARVALARAIVSHPKYLFCDEPTGNLDEINSKIVLDQLKLYSLNHLVIMVSHNRSYTSQYCDKVIQITKGVLNTNE